MRHRQGQRKGGVLTLPDGPIRIVFELSPAVPQQPVEVNCPVRPFRRPVDVGDVPGRGHLQPPGCTADVRRGVAETGPKRRRIRKEAACMVRPAHEPHRQRRKVRRPAHRKPRVGSRSTFTLLRSAALTDKGQEQRPVGRHVGSALVDPPSHPLTVIECIGVGPPDAQADPVAGPPAEDDRDWRGSREIDEEPARAMGGGASRTLLHQSTRPVPPGAPRTGSRLESFGRTRKTRHHG